jgi:hypothetical protein
LSPYENSLILLSSISSKKFNCLLLMPLESVLLQVIEYDVFEPLALEFCARVSSTIMQGFSLTRSLYSIISLTRLLFYQKVAAASGDMRKALGVCR